MRFKIVLIWILSVGLSAAAITSTLGAVARSLAPDIAVSLWPVNGFAVQKIAARDFSSQVATNQGSFPDNIDLRLSNLALMAFQAEPATPDAIAIISFEMNRAVQKSLMDKAFELSRRQNLVTGWMIVDRGAAEDVPGVLKYYDTILRTSSSSADIFLPTMASGLTDERFIKPLADLLTQDPPWAGRFWGQVVENKASLENAAELRRQMYSPKNDQNSFRDRALVNALVADNQLATAEKVYSLLTNGKNGAVIVRNGKFLVDPEYPPLDWQLTNTGEYGSSIGQESLNLSAIGNSGGLFARQLIKLPKKVLKLQLEFEKLLPKDVELNLQFSCAEDIANKPATLKIRLNTKTVTRKISNKGSQCSYYWLDIIGRSSRNGDGLEASINSVSLQP